MFRLCIIIYNFLIYIIQPVIFIQLLWRSKSIPGYRKNWTERYGFYFCKKIKPNGIVLHAVSLGETLLAIPLIKYIQKHYPKIPITLTSMTLSGLELAHKYTSNYHVQCMYLPYDLPGAMKRFVKKIQPKLVIIMEKELWPNLINILYQNNIPLIIANARLSFDSFVKYNKIKRFFSHIIQRITIIIAQNESDASRFLRLGFQKTKLHITGNLKFDITIPQDLLKKIKFLKKTWIKQRLTWIASSTHLGEEKILLSVHKQLLIMFPSLLMILTPRHPERFFDVALITKSFGFSYIMKSSGIAPTINIQVIINDTIGELMLLYGISDIAFIGGSLVRHGGHNPLEPAVLSLPIITGPYTFNFSEICSKLRILNGLININDEQSLTQVMSVLLKNKNLRAYYGNCAARVFKKNQGSLQRLLSLLHKYLIY